jgi:hypothetical protein
VEDNTPPVDAPPEAFTAKLTKFGVAPKVAQVVEQFVVRAR